MSFMIILSILNFKIIINCSYKIRYSFSTPQIINNSNINGSFNVTTITANRIYLQNRSTQPK